MNNTADYTQCIIKVIKKSKNKYGLKAEVGDILYTIRSFVNAWGTHKLSCVNSRGDELMVTFKSVEFLDKNFSSQTNFDIDRSLQLWVDKTHIPIIFKPVALSRNKQSIKCDIINSTKFTDCWLSLKFARDQKGKSVKSEKIVLKKFQSAYIPTWFAKKIGLISKKKDN